MAKKQDIMEATFKLFSEKGYYLSMADIADRVGLKTPSLYSHFSGKDEIIFWVMKKEITDYYDLLKGEIHQLIPLDISSEEKLKQICFSVSNYFKKKEIIRFWKNISLIYNEELRFKCRDLVKQYDTEIILLLQKLYQKGIEQDEIRIESVEGSVYLYWTMLQGILDSILVHGGMDQEIEPYIALIWQAYWNGIKR